MVQYDYEGLVREAMDLLAGLMQGANTPPATRWVAPICVTGDTVCPPCGMPTP